jgi:F0F1-type ATP synthase, alpha subunit
VSLFRDELAKYMQERHPALRKSLSDGKISDEASKRLKQHIASFKEHFLSTCPNKVKEEDVTAKAESNKTNALDQNVKVGE